MGRSRSRSRSKSRSKSRSRRRSRSRSSPRRSPYSRRRSSSRRRSHSRSRSRSRSPKKRGRGRSPSRSPSRRRQRVPSRSGSGSRGASSDRETSGRIWVAHGDCARIIGRKGEARKDIESQSEAQLKIQREEDMERGSKERYVELLGNARQRKKAIKMILKIATFCRDDNGKVLKDGNVGSGGGGSAESLIIQQGEVGKVLGRGGENIRRIEEESGARLELDRNEGRLDIRGPPDAVSRARDMVLSEVSHARNGSGAVIKDAHHNQTSSGGGGGGNSPWILWVQSKEAGRVIGRGGEAVRELMERTGAEVKVQRGDGKDDGEREIKISGSEAQRLEALFGISSHVNFIRCEQGVIKTPEMSPSEAEESLRRYASGGASPWMGGPPMMMPPPGMMPPGMAPPGMMPPGMPGMMPLGMPPGMAPLGMHQPPGRQRASSSSSSSSSSSGDKKKKKKKNKGKAAKGNMQNTWMDPWQAQMAARSMAYPPPTQTFIMEEEKNAIDWDEL